MYVCKQRILKTIVTDFSRKEKAITSSQKNVYSCIYITKKLNGRSNTKLTKSFIFIVVPEQKLNVIGIE